MESNTLTREGLIAAVLTALSIVASLFTVESLRNYRKTRDHAAEFLAHVRAWVYEVTQWESEHGTDADLPGGVDRATRPRLTVDIPPRVMRVRSRRIGRTQEKQLRDWLQIIISSLFVILFGLGGLYLALNPLTWDFSRFALGYTLTFSLVCVAIVTAWTVEHRRTVDAIVYLRAELEREDHAHPEARDELRRLLARLSPGPE